MDDEATFSPELMLLICFGATVALQCSFFAIAFICQFDKVTDFAGTLNFFALAVLSLFVQGLYTPRTIVVTSLVTLWALRLGSHLVKRVLARGKDERFDEMRQDCLRFFGFWVFQILWVFIVSLPVILVNSGDHESVHFNRPEDIIGLILWIFGFFIEWAADQSKETFYNDKANKGKLLCTNVWRYSRHPNYCGEILCWIGITVIASVCFKGSHQWFYVSLVSPLFTAVLLLFLSGIPLAEERYDTRFGLQPFYLEYKKTTSPLLLLPPAVYGKLPSWFKLCFLFEFPMYSKTLRELQAKTLAKTVEKEGEEEREDISGDYGSIP